MNLNLIFVQPSRFFPCRAPGGRIWGGSGRQLAHLQLCLRKPENFCASSELAAALSCLRRALALAGEDGDLFWRQFGARRPACQRAPS